MERFWNFRERTPAEMNINPVQGEFFAKSDVVDRLVRETLQNSLDARVDDQPAHVKFSLRELKLDSVKRKHYFGGLDQHLRGSENEFNMDDPDYQAFMTIEDFGTKGLLGDPKSNPRSNADAAGNDFYYFFRNVGLTGKRGNEGGSWGLGKWVLPDASKANIFFALTHRADTKDQTTLFMGQAVLKQHYIDNKKYDAYGFFARIDHSEQCKGLPMPFDLEHAEDEKIIGDFINDFGLTREVEPGLSVVIPFVSIGNSQTNGDSDDSNHSFSAHDIIRSVIKYYFFPIILGDLIVEADDLNNSYTLDKTTIDETLPQLTWGEHRELNEQDLGELIHMARNYTSLAKDDYIEWDLNDANSKSEEEIQDLVDKFNNCDQLNFQIPLEVKRKGDNPETQLSKFAVIIQKDEGITEGKDYYVRGNLAIQDIDMVKKYPVRVFVHIDKEELLSSLLRDTEEPSHSSWRPNADKAMKNFRNVRKSILYVKNAARDILKILNDHDKNEKDRDAFSDIFNLDKRRPGKKKGGKKETPETPNISPITQLLPFTITRSASGFTLTNTNGQITLDHIIDVEVAYECGPSSLKRYSPFDFKLNELPIEITYAGCHINKAEDNKLTLSNIQEDFKVTINGFDKRRDLHILAKQIDTKQIELGDSDA